MNKNEDAYINIISNISFTLTKATHRVNELEDENKMLRAKIEDNTKILQSKIDGLQEEIKTLLTQNGKISSKLLLIKRFLNCLLSFFPPFL